MYSRFPSFLNTEMWKVVEIFADRRQETAY